MSRMLVIGQAGRNDVTMSSRLKANNTDLYNKLPSVFDISNLYTIRYHFFHKSKGKKTNSLHLCNGADTV